MHVPKSDGIASETYKKEMFASESRLKDFKINLWALRGETVVVSGLLGTSPCLINPSRLLMALPCMLLSSDRPLSPSP